MKKANARTLTHIEADGSKTVTTYWPKRHWWNLLEESVQREKIQYKPDGTILEGSFDKNGKPSVVTAFKDDKKTIMMRWLFNEKGAMQRIESMFIDNAPLCISEYSPQEDGFVVNDTAFIAYLNQKTRQP